MKNKIRNKIIATALIVFMIVSTIPAHTYAGGNQKVYNNDNGSEESQNDGQEEEVTEENNFVYDILDEMLEEVEKEEGEEIEENTENEGISLLWGNDKTDPDNYGHYTSAGYAGKGLSAEIIEKLKIAATMPDDFAKENAAKVFHGKGNYVANISYMWELAQELGKNSDKKAVLAKVEKNATARYKSKLTTKDWGILKELMDKMDGILAINNVHGDGIRPSVQKIQSIGVGNAYGRRYLCTQNYGAGRCPHGYSKCKGL